MTTTLKILASAAALLSAAACAGPDIDKLRAAPQASDPFNRTLVREYLKFAVTEADEMDDWADASHFARKGLRAAHGQTTAPEKLSVWRLPASHTGPIAKARLRLVKVLDGGARSADSERAAIAQARFDCWVEQQEENFQPDDIAACRDRFFAELKVLERRPTAAPANAALGANGRYVVFFDHNAVTVGKTSAPVIAAAAAQAKRARARALVVGGHADRAGPRGYNAILSQRRADAVRAALIRAGLRPERISVTAYGEHLPLVPTADGVREPKNRRAEIVLH